MWPAWKPKTKHLLRAAASGSQADSLTGEDLHDDWMLGPTQCETVSKRSRLVPLWCVRGSMNGTFNSGKCVKNCGMGGIAAYSIRHSGAPSFPRLLCDVSEPASVCCFQCCWLWVPGIVPGA